MSNLKLKSITKSFGNNKVLNSIDFECKTGEIVGLFGRNGSGKTTLLKILFGTLKADTIDVQLDFMPFDPKENISDREIAYLPQDNFLPKDLTVRNTIPIYYQEEEKQNQIFYDPQIAKIETRRIGTLSYGELRYLEILLILNLPHRFILLDEPFSMIEPHYQDAIKDLLLILKQNKGIILTDHYYYDVLQITDKNILIKDGQSFPISNKRELSDNGYLPRQKSSFI
jgi:ABC-type multidrug transport system ATPase subunit